MTLPEGVTLRAATPDDADALITMHHASWDEAYADLVPAPLLAVWKGDHEERVRTRREWLTHGPAETTLAVVSDELEGEAVVGFATVGPCRDAEPAAAREVWAIYVRAAWWSTGVGHALLSAALGDHDASLWVLAGNDRAVGFYRRQGFALDGGSEEHEEGRHLRMVRRHRRPPG